ncbi:MAG TPA: hypothetical protein VHZ97_22555 [Pseudonocardiaceae bacterium]|jgi:hypothetical protein|nr:hypothetical protein [Pseudonocardiaceae bacterium]
MRSLRVGLAIGAAVLVLVAGCAHAPKAAGHATLTTTLPTTTLPAQASNGDGPPDAGDNQLHPRTVSPAEQQAGDAAAAKAKTTLTAVRSSGPITEVRVQNALARAGFDPNEFYAVAGGSAVSFGISVDGGGVCVKGSVDSKNLTAEVEGPIPDWGCGIVGDTH